MRTKQYEVEVISLTLKYSATLDVFICVFSSTFRHKGDTVSAQTATYSIALVDPATLRKLLVYRGPKSQSLQCLHYDPHTDRLVLACLLHTNEQDETRGPANIVEILQISKRPDDRLASPQADDQEHSNQILQIEKMQVSLIHSDVLTLICGSTGLREMYGVAGDEVNETSMLLVWRLHQVIGEKLVLVSRVMVLYRISAMALSPCEDWLLIGAHDGGLKVWNVNDSRLSRLGQSTTDATPYEAIETRADSTRTEAIISIQIVRTCAMSSTGEWDAESSDMIVIVAERETGVVRHWNLLILEKDQTEYIGDAVDFRNQRFPRLNPVGGFNTEGKKGLQTSKKVKMVANSDTHGPSLQTLTMCVAIDMGSCKGYLLLIVRGDVIHALKMQAVSYTLQEFRPLEALCALRSINWQNTSQIITLSRTGRYNLRAFSMDEVSRNASSVFMPVDIDQRKDGHVCAMEIATNKSLQKNLVILAWDSGIVDVYDVENEKCLMTLRDDRITDQISALSVVIHQQTQTSKAALAKTKARDARNHSSRDTVANDTCVKAVTPGTMIVVGTENGNLYGWNVKKMWLGGSASQSILQANVQVESAHSSYVVQFAQIGGSLGDRALMASVSASGLVKLWSVPSLKMRNYVDSIAGGYLAAPSCIELMRDQKEVFDDNIFCVSVGYDDGRLAVWRVNVNNQPCLLKGLAKHERRVTKICRASTTAVQTGMTEFLSCSLDMTVIQWKITQAESVQAKRYFDVGASIIDMIVVNSQAVLALAHEICMLFYASRREDSQTENELKSDSVANKYAYDQLKCTAGEISPYVTESSRDTSTIPSTEYIAEVSDPPSPTLYSENMAFESQFLSTVNDFKDASSSVLRPNSVMGALQTTQMQSEDFLHPRSDPTDKVAFSARSGICTKQHSRVIVNDDILIKYLKDFITRYGTSGMMAARLIPDFLASRPELPRVKRAGFALAKSLRDLNLNAQTPVDHEKALQVLKIIFTMRKTSRQSYDAPTMAYKVKHSHTGSKIEGRQRGSEKKQTRRKPVVTYNLLGEKSVRWEKEILENEKSRCKRSSTSSTTNLTARTSFGPTARDVGGEPLHGRTSAVLKSNGEASSFDKHRACALSHTSSGTSSPSGIIEQICGEEKDEIVTNEVGINNDQDRNDSESDYFETSKNQVYDQLLRCTEAVKATDAIEKRDKAITEDNIEFKADNATNALMNNIRLSPLFQPFWRKGYCWCRPAPYLYIIWAQSDTATVGKPKSSIPKYNCIMCQKRLHTVELPRIGLVTHFSRQATFDIIIKVYSKLSATAQKRLFKTSSSTNGRSLECSIHGTLYEIFLISYGVRSTAELKMKLFLVSMCQWLPDYDAIAVFGELLGLHQPAEDDHQAPAALVALCVCSHTWLYSRGTVVNGDLLTGCFSGRGRERETSEVVSATNGLCTALTDLLFERRLVGEWKHQNAQFRAAERLLFVYPQQSIRIEGDWLEKLRLLLNCYIFYDHERDGVVTVSDFDTLMFKLRYLWMEDCMKSNSPCSLSDDVFTSTLSEIKERFIDRNYDGRLCYLDFWVMLYMAAFKTHDFLSFQEISSFCRSYRLEVTPELSDVVWNYMLRSCTVVLPKGLYFGKSSMDQKVERQHRRRIGGLHDGTFHFANSLTESLSTQDLLRRDDTKSLGLFLDGSRPAFRRAASTTALQQFRFISIDDDARLATACDGSSRKPIVYGYRPIGPTRKSIAPLRVLFMGNDGSVSGFENAVSHSRVKQMGPDQDAISQGEYSNSYIQFPDVTPVCTSVKTTEAPRENRGHFLLKRNLCKDSLIQIRGQKGSSSMKTSTSRIRLSSIAVLAPEEEEDTLERSAQISTSTKRHCATPAVVVPKKIPKAQGSSDLELLMRQLSLELVYTISERIEHENEILQCVLDLVKLATNSQFSTLQEDILTNDETRGECVATFEQLNERDSHYFEVEVDEAALQDVTQPSLIDSKMYILADTSELADAPTDFEKEVVRNKVGTLSAAVKGTPEKLFEENDDTFKKSSIFRSDESQSMGEFISKLSFVNQVGNDKELQESSNNTPNNSGRAKLDDIYHRRKYRFFHQPEFIRSVSVMNEMSHKTMWNPSEETVSDGDDDAVEKTGTLENFNYGRASKKEVMSLENNGITLHDQDDANMALLPARCQRLDEVAERALYGERVVNALDEGLAFSSESDGAMQKKWQQYFDDSESRLFSVMRKDLEERQKEMREADEHQIKLRQKWQQQRDQDLAQLQYSRQRRSLLMSAKQDLSTDPADSRFRMKRIRRESCQQITEELLSGVSIQRELHEAEQTHLFHFYYRPDGHTSIVTLKMHVLRGNAEFFMSTDTKAPCATDFMWRSTKRLSTNLVDGHRIILYPHDLVQKMAVSDAEMMTTSDVKRTVYYLSVVALERDTVFTLAVMPSGQKIQPSRAMQTVDNLIDRFNKITKAFNEKSTRSFAMINEPLPSNVSTRHIGKEEDKDADNANAIENTNTQQKTRKATDDEEDRQDLKSFQRLLDVLSEKRGFGSPRPASILLTGPSDEHLEFVQDEDHNLKILHQQQLLSKFSDDVISSGFERRFDLRGKQNKIHKAVAARLHQKLAPLRHKFSPENEKSAIFGTLNDLEVPRPVAYSITSLDPLLRSKRYKLP
ncbi:WD40/YVTN repeat-like-containing domain [Plasmopara halstedii]|uniref:WD40/YVTN repeat-like-containing domain n=1 Tax=Plasmopara halstedii TaxID=4781 RepID=A0A0P1A5X9_PLAHL|nr:WD40/YVTN repeat-like-containing domain [Plasmopara halstedii]CEG35551.1 WD40/YVTN repeat-like-containing domain [Plasmopara halstedii]|eukprot:XP_024571920.1 WD40/YVTN repeat-like-containing domain [Plasmopara halstedii]